MEKGMEKWMVITKIPRTDHRYCVHYRDRYRDFRRFSLPEKQRPLIFHCKYLRKTIEYDDPKYTHCEDFFRFSDYLRLHDEKIMRKFPEIWPQIELIIDRNFTDTPHICPVCHQDCFSKKKRKLSGMRVQDGKKYQWWHGAHFQDLGIEIYPILLGA